MCMTVPLSKLTGLYPATATVSFYAGLLLLLVVIVQSASKIVTGAVHDRITRIGYVLAVATIVCGFSAGYLFGPDGTGLATSIASITVERTWAPFAFLLGTLSAFAALYYASSELTEDVAEYKPIHLDKRLPVTPLTNKVVTRSSGSIPLEGSGRNARPPTQPPLIAGPSPQAVASAPTICARRRRHRPAARRRHRAGCARKTCARRRPPHPAARRHHRVARASTNLRSPPLSPPTRSLTPGGSFTRTDATGRSMTPSTGFARTDATRPVDDAERRIRAHGHDADGWLRTRRDHAGRRLRPHRRHAHASADATATRHAHAPADATAVRAHRRHAYESAVAATVRRAHDVASPASPIRRERKLRRNNRSSHARRRHLASPIRRERRHRRNSRSPRLHHPASPIQTVASRRRNNRSSHARRRHLASPIRRERRHRRNSRSRATSSSGVADPSRTKTSSQPPFVARTTSPSGIADPTRSKSPSQPQIDPVVRARTSSSGPIDLAARLSASVPNPLERAPNLAVSIRPPLPTPEPVPPDQIPVDPAAGLTIRKRTASASPHSEMMLTPLTGMPVAAAAAPMTPSSPSPALPDHAFEPPIAIPTPPESGLLIRQRRPSAAPPRRSPPATM